MTQAGEKRPEMPPKEEPFTDYEVSLVKKWVEQGATDDTPENARQRYSQATPPRYSVLPNLTSLDRFVLGLLTLFIKPHRISKLSTSCHWDIVEIPQGSGRSKVPSALFIFR